MLYKGYPPNLSVGRYFINRLHPEPEFHTGLLPCLYNCPADLFQFAFSYHSPPVHSVTFMAVSCDLIFLRLHDILKSRRDEDV